MKKESISREAILQVIRKYKEQYFRKPWRAFLMFFAPAVGTILIFFIPPLLIGKIVNVFIAEGVVSLGPVTHLVILFGVLWFLGELLWRMGDHFMTRVKADGTVALNEYAFEQTVHRDYTFYANTFVGSLTKKALSFSKGFETATDLLVYNVFNNVFPIIFAMVILCKYSPWFAVVIVGAFLLVASIAIPLIRKRARLVDLRHEANSKMMGQLSDSITNMLAVKSFAQEKREMNTYHISAVDHGEKVKNASDYNNLRLNMVISPLYAGTNLVGLILAIFFTHRFSLPAGTVIVVFSYFSIITRMLWDINHVYRGFETAISEAAEYTQMFIKPPLVTDREGAKDLRITDAAVSFDNISFGYPGRQKGKTFLNGFTLTIPRNQKVGLVGPSGSGKTTITKLMLRFLDVQSGSIEIDGQNISEITQTSLRKAIAYVPQESLLFHRTLRENIAYGNEHATDREVVKASKLAHAHEFISRLPHGYNTMVGERGIKLSGGQRQRVAIARALLKKSSILVLDEATSSLDSESEKYIQDGLVELMKNKTALVIAHRLSTIKNLDRIIVLDQGRIVQDGTHDELIAQEGLYAKLWSHQSGEFLE